MHRGSDSLPVESAPPRVASWSAGKRWLAVVLVLILALIGGAVSFSRQGRTARLAKECAVLAKREDWPRLEELTREWTAVESSPLAWFWLGTALKEQREYSDAREAFARVPVDGLRGIDAAVARMEILYHIDERPLEAIELARDLLRRDPQLASPRRHLIHFYATTLQRPEMMREIHLAIKYRSDVPEHYVYLFSVEDLSFSDAEQVTERWAAAEPASSLLQLAHEMHRLRAVRTGTLDAPTPQLIEQYEELCREVAARVDRDLTNPIVLETFLLLATDKADVDEVGRLLGLAPDQAADDPVFWRYRGWYATKTGDLQEAADSYRKALDLLPLGWQTRHEYANLLRLSGKVDEAGRYQATSALGSDLANDIRRLTRVRDATPELMSRLARFARDCGDNEVANGIIRRYEPKNR